MKSCNAVKTLVDGYLHEDFVDCYGSAWGAVDSYVRDQPQLAPQLRGEITELLSRCKSESEVERALVDLGIVYLPTGDGWDSHRTWLLAVAERVDQLRTSPTA